MPGGAQRRPTMTEQLRLALRSLDARKYEQFCFDLLRAKYPGSEIRRVEGSAGDEGIDSFSGELECGPTVWQCKRFPDAIGPSQKEQIRKSLQRALAHSAPSLWVLCIPIDMDIKAHRWWQKLRESNRGRVNLDLMTASETIHELIFRRTLRAAYFPNVEFDASTLRALIHRTDDLTDEQLASLTTDRAEEYLDRLRDRDARFDYQLTVGNEGGPPLSSDHPSLIASMIDGHKRVDVFARDVQALMLDPPKVRIGFVGSGVNKIQDLVQRGGSADFEPSELGSLSSNLV